MQEYILEMRNITKEFPGVKALDQVSFQVKKGEIHALVGENGAGKSTLMKVLSGVYPHGTYRGDIVVNGQVCSFGSIHQSEEAGIAIIHQELALIPLLSIAENVYLGRPEKSRGSIDWNKTRAATIPLLERVGLKEDPDTPINQLGVGKQQLVEIAKALSKKCRILILDEPTAALNEKDSKNLLDLLKSLQAEGMTCIIISHKLNEICYVADSITVLRDGRTVADFDDAAKVNEDEIIRHMVGRELSNRYPARTHVPSPDVFFEVKNWNVGHPEFPDRRIVKDLNIQLRKGEVVGLSGLMGAGRTEFAMSLFGKSYGSNISGEVYLNGEKIDASAVTFPVTMILAVVCCLVFVLTQIKNRRNKIKHGVPVKSVWGMVVRIVVICAVLLALSYMLAINKGYPTVLVIMLVLTLIYSFICNRTVFGRSLYAVGGNRKAAALSGIKDRWSLFMAYTNMGLISAVAAIVYLSRMDVATPKAATGYELDAIAACYVGGASVTGGAGTVSGALVGCLVIGILNNAMSLVGISPDWQQAVKGLVILAAVAFDMIPKMRKK